MILEEATKEAYGYYARDLTHGSRKWIIAACELCGKFKMLKRHEYRTLCISCVQKGKIPWNLNIKATEEARANLRAARKGKQPALGCKHREECKAKMSALMKGNTYCLGYKHTEEAKANMSAAQKGNTSSVGRVLTDEHKAKLSAAKKGEKCYNWQGGKSFEPYCIKFNNALKEYIRAKFGYTCFLCPTTQAENGKKLSVHHVNYNKDCGCDGDKTCQFVPLCKSCHSKTNNNRDYWQKIITEKLHNTIIGWDV